MVSNNGGKIFPCQHCDLSLFSLLDKIRHDKKLHQPVQKPQTRSQAHNTNRRRRPRQLFDIIPRQKAKIQQTFHCPLCRETFGSPEPFREHMLLHRTCPLLPCPLCEETSPSQATLEEHLQERHEEQRCEVCSGCDRFVTLEFLRLIPAPLEGRSLRGKESHQYVCEKCDSLQKSPKEEFMIFPKKEDDEEEENYEILTYDHSPFNLQGLPLSLVIELDD